MLNRLVCLTAALAVALATPAFADDSAFNKEGYWAVGRGDADSDSCVASIATDKDMLVLHALDGGISVTVGTLREGLRRGKTAVLATDAHSFEFELNYNDEGKILALRGNLSGRAIAALRLATDLSVLVDGEPVFAVKVEGTGLDGALDAVVACSQGKSGWWGPGVNAESLADGGPAPDQAADDIVYNQEGIWAVAAGEQPGICVAQASAGEGRHLQILAARGVTGLAIGADGQDLPRGRMGRVETDAYSFDFKPDYGAGGYMATKEPFDSQALFALRRAKWVRVTVDDRALIDVSLEGSGFAELLDAVAACSRSEKGWWGEGAKPR